MQTLLIAAYNDDRSLIDFLYKNGLNWSPELCHVTACLGKFELLDFILSLKANPIENNQIHQSQSEMAYKWHPRATCYLAKYPEALRHVLSLPRELQPAIHVETLLFAYWFGTDDKLADLHLPSAQQRPLLTDDIEKHSILGGLTASDATHTAAINPSEARVGR